ncbi:MAG: F0F1 ATP synthase subunit delta [Candidatus Omnitrophota bacterium]
MLIIPLILLQVIIFAGLVFFLRKILQRNVVKATDHLEQLSAEYVKKDEAIKKKLEETQRQCQEILANAQKDAQKQQGEIIAKAEAERDKIINKAQEKGEEFVQQAERTRQALISEINQKIEEKAVQRAADLVQAVLPEHIREEIHRRWLDELIASSLEQLERLHIPEGDLEAKIVSAFTLNPKQLQGLKAKVKEKLGRDIDIKEEVNPDIVAGLVVNLGSLVLDGSLKFKIQEAISGQQRSS